MFTLQARLEEHCRLAWRSIAGSLGGALHARLEEHCRLAWRSIAGSLGGALQARLDEHCRLAWRSTAGSLGGAALMLNCPASLLARECFFSTANPPSPATTGERVAGCVHVTNILSVSMDDCFFARSTASNDGALTLSGGTHSVLFNCAFVLCSATNFGGAAVIRETATFPTDNFTHCDTTSAQPNVFFHNGSKSDSGLVPLVTSPPTPTISDIDIQFDEERMLATVSVAASGEIGGTMGILLDGLVVPRLVHVTFGSETELSRSGSAVVSSGPLGVLPKANYTATNQSFAAVFLAPRIIDCVCSLKDANTSVIVVSRWELEEGNYVMEFTDGQDGAEKEISLTWVNTWTLEGTALLYPSEAEGRLDWETEFEVRCVVRRTPSEDTNIELSRTLQFTTPKEPIRIEGADCSLDGEKEKAGVVEFWGECLSNGDEYTLKVKREVEGVVSGEVIELNGTLSSESESGSFLHTEEIFGTSSPHVSFGETYLVVGIVVGGVDGVVNGDIRFSVPAEPSRLTKITASAFVDNDKTQIELSFDVHALKANTLTITM
ncbi:hypothetical protein BLNAU_15293 [Blattamonas nauphoetae]|uniref:Uncharacterized protein n=1 Tax=Blattamonas nauphoetae TaxID=2049346 RepID=A0ABQ9XFT7_9EUKA|nr:hypothetical protein BLNAU_15293 [Blattamonas nauphoetae]